LGQPQGWVSNHPQSIQDLYFLQIYSGWYTLLSQPRLADATNGCDLKCQHRGHSFDTRRSSNRDGSLGHAKWTNPQDLQNHREMSL